MKLLVSQSDICKQLKIGAGRIQEVLDALDALDALGVKPLSKGSGSKNAHKLWRWCDIVKALGGTEAEAETKLSALPPKPKKVNVCGMWMEAEQAAQIDEVCSTLGVERKELLRTALLDFVAKLAAKPVPHTNGLAAESRL